MQDGINSNSKYDFTSQWAGTYKYSYYSNSDAKSHLNSWYTNNLSSYSSMIATGNYYCEQAKVKSYSGATAGNATMTLDSSYTPNFKCSADGNGYGMINSNIGLITYDEVVHAGGYSGKDNSSYYLYNGNNYWTMTPSGEIEYGYPFVWFVGPTGSPSGNRGNSDHNLRPVINLKADVEVTGTGTSTEPYTISSFKYKILANNTIITTTPTLTNSSNNTSDASGLYKSTATNSGKPTYYFRGNVTNNYVSFAGFTWRIVRINEDGTVRLIMQDGINSNTAYAYANGSASVNNMYYVFNPANSNAKSLLDSWYATNITNKGYSDKVVTGSYYCQQAKTARSSAYATSSGASMTVYTSYTPNFKCEKDGNGYGPIYSNVGLITYDELVHAGGYYGKTNSSYYLYNGNNFWTMSPAGFNGTSASGWDVYSTGDVGYNVTTNTYRLRPVINIKADVSVTGSGTSTNPYVVK